MVKKIMTLFLALAMLLALVGCGGDSNSSTAPTDDEVSENAPDETDPGEELSLSLDKQIYFDKYILAYIKDDGSAVVDFGEGNESDSEELQAKIDAANQKWAGVIKAEYFDNYVWLLSADGKLYKISNKKTEILKEGVANFSRSDYNEIIVYNDGTVELISERENSNRPDLSAVNEWTDIVAVHSNTTAAIGIKKDGTVVATGDNSKGQISVNDWQDISQAVVYDTVSSLDIESTEAFILGLKTDGTLVFSGQYFFEEDVSELLAITDVREISYNYDSIILIKNDGTVVSLPNSAVGDFFAEDKDIAYLGFDMSRQQYYLYVKNDGTIVTDPKLDFLAGHSMK